MNNTCTDAALANLMGIVNNVLTIIQILGPILSIISLTIIFIGLVSNPEDKKAKKKITNSIIALVLTFFIPIIVNAAMNLVDENSNISLCWKNAKVNGFGNSEYIEPGGSKKPVVTDPSLYGSGQTNSNSKSTGAIFIGDSRTVQMYAYLSNDWGGANYSSGGAHKVGSDVFVAEGSQGLAWMKSTGIPAAQSYFNKNSAVVILMGVNDIGNASNYLSYINQNAASWKGKVYFVSVNPCQGSYSHLNSSIDSFNSTMKSGLNSKIGWIDTNSHLKSSGFTTTDGLHYDAATSKKIYDYIKSKV